MMTVIDSDKVLEQTTVGTADSKPEGVKIVFLVRRGRTYLVEEQTAFTYRCRTFDSKHRKRDSLRAYLRASKTPRFTLRGDT